MPSANAGALALAACPRAQASQHELTIERRHAHPGEPRRPSTSDRPSRDSEIGPRSQSSGPRDGGRYR